MPGASFHGVLTYVYGGLLKSAEDVSELLRNNPWSDSSGRWEPYGDMEDNVICDSTGNRYDLDAMVDDMRYVLDFKNCESVLWRELSAEGITILSSGGDTDGDSPNDWVDLFWAFDSIQVTVSGECISLMQWVGFN